MDQPQKIKFSADSVNLLDITWRNWKLLLFTALSVFVISAAVSFLVKPLYRATVVLYPTTNVSGTQSLFAVQSKATPLFGDEIATEKVLQILKSDNIKAFIVNKYDLMNHYGISPKARYRYTLLENRLKKYIVSRKTQYSSVEISVLDPDPQIAASVANDISRRIDTVFNEIVREAGRKDFAAALGTYNEQLAKVRELEDSIKLSVPATQAGMDPGKIKAGSARSSWSAAILNYSPEMLRLINMFEAENESLSAIRNRLTEAGMAVEQVLPYTHIINEAKVPEKKDLPKRSLIVLASVASSLVLMIFFLALRGMTVKNE